MSKVMVENMITFKRGEGSDIFEHFNMLISEFEDTQVHCSDGKIFLNRLVAGIFWPELTDALHLNFESGIIDIILPDTEKKALQAVWSVQ